MAEETLTVLLVEDNPGDARLVAEAFAEAKVSRPNLVLAESLGLALRYCRQQDFDIALLDLGLPDSQGLESLDRLKSSDLDAPIVVFTGLNDEALGLDALQKGAEDYIVKGEVESKDLFRLVRYAIERWGLEARTREAERESARLETLSEITSSLAHHIGNALTPILGYAEMSDPEAHIHCARLRETVLSHGRKIAAILGALVQISRSKDPSLLALGLLSTEDSGSIDRAIRRFIENVEA